MITPDENKLRKFSGHIIREHIKKDPTLRVRHSPNFYDAKGDLRTEGVVSSVSEAGEVEVILDDGRVVTYPAEEVRIVGKDGPIL